MTYQFLAPWVLLGCVHQLGSTFDSACLRSIIVNGWVYSHAPKWFSWLVCFVDNDGSGLVRIRHVSDWALVVCLAIDWLVYLRGWGHQCAEPDLRLCKFSMGLKWRCIFIANKRESFLPWLRLISLWKRSKTWVQRSHFSDVLPLYESIKTCNNGS